MEEKVSARGEDKWMQFVGERRSGPLSWAITVIHWLGHWDVGGVSAYRVISCHIM